jgi:hypothetical protein
VRPPPPEYSLIGAQHHGLAGGHELRTADRSSRVVSIREINA